MATVIGATLPTLTAAAESGFTVARLRGFQAGGFAGLADGDLQVLLDAAFLAIDDAIGPAGETSELLGPVHGDLLPLSRRVASITSVVENTRYSPVTLAADDYELSASGRMLVRLRTGTHPGYSWCGRVKPTYVPVDDTAQRIRVAVELVKLGITFNPGLASQAIGTWSESYSTSVPYPEQREAILATLSDGVWIR